MPLVVVDPAWTIVAANRMAHVLLGDDPVVGSDLRVVLWTATPGSSDASALAVLSVVGTQQFAT